MDTIASQMASNHRQKWPICSDMSDIAHD